MDTFFCALADILEVDEVHPSDVLADFEGWDSLSILSIISLSDSDYHVNLAAAEVKSCETAEQLYQLIQGKR